MRRTASALPLALAAMLAGCNGARPSRPEPTPEFRLSAPADLPTDLGARAYAHAKALVEMGPRHSGSPGWQKGVTYISSQLRDLGLQVDVDRWQNPVEKLTFQNVRAVIPGRSPERLLIAAHHDTKNTTGHDDPAHNFDFVGANDSASGVALLLALAADLAQQPQPVTIELLFFDGEESVPYDWDIDRALFGSRRFVRRYQQARLDDPRTPPILALVLCDMVGAADLQIDRETRSSADLVGIFAAAATACGHQELFFQVEYGVIDDHLPFLDEGIPAIDLIDLHDNPQWHTAEDTLEHLSPRSLQIVGEVVWTALPAIAEHYSPSKADEPGPDRPPEAR